MSKGFWAIIIAIIVIFGGFLWFRDHKTNAPGSTTVQTSNHVEGNGQKNVTLIEYGDYECPFCEQYYPVVKQVVAQYSNDIKFEFRNLPLSQIHQNAFAAARAAEASGLQNKFWEMHDMLYEDQSSWVNASDPQAVFNQFAQQLGLNVTQFKQDFSSSKVNDLINGDVAAFNKTGQEMATPTFFLDGKKISPNITFESDQKTVNVPASAATFSQLITQEIATKK